MNSIATAAVQYRALDLAVYIEGKGFCPSKFGVVEVRQSLSGPGYVAESEREKAFGLTPAFAYSELIDLIERDRHYEATLLANAKQAYFRWRDGWSGYEDADSYSDEDHERRTALGITSQDERDWQQRRDAGIDF